MRVTSYLLTILFFCMGLTLFSQQVVEMYVSSRNTNSVKLFNGETGEFIEDFVAEGAGGLSKTQDVAFGPGGHLYVTGIDNSAILKYDGMTGEFLGEFTSGYELHGPTKFTFHDDGLVYVSQWGEKKEIARFNSQTGEFVDAFATSGLDLACGHAWDNLGNLFVADYSLKSVMFYEPDGSTGGNFTLGDELEGPVNVWFRDNGNLIVLDWMRGEALEYEYPTGNFVGEYLTGLQRAEGFAFGPDSSLYVCDWITDDIKKYDKEGNFIEVFTDEGEMEAPNAVTFRIIDPTSVEEDELPNRIELKQNYPNPFNPTTTIEFYIPQTIDGEISLDLFDVLGNKLRTIKEGINSPGSYSYSFSSGNLASGVYFYRLTGAYFSSQIRKMILMK